MLTSLSLCLPAHSGPWLGEEKEEPTHPTREPREHREDDAEYDEDDLLATTEPALGGGIVVVRENLGDAIKRLEGTTTTSTQTSAFPLLLCCAVLCCAVLCSLTRDERMNIF